MVFSCIPVPCYNTLIEEYDEAISEFGLNPTELRTLVDNECSRRRDDGSTVFYREMRLPIHLLKSIYVRKEATREEVVRFIAESELNTSVRSI